MSQTDDGTRTWQLQPSTGLNLTAGCVYSWHRPYNWHTGSFRISHSNGTFEAHIRAWSHMGQDMGCRSIRLSSTPENVGWCMKTQATSLPGQTFNPQFIITNASGTASEGQSITSQPLWRSAAAVRKEEDEESKGAFEPVVDTGGEETKATMSTPTSGLLGQTEQRQGAEDAQSAIKKEEKEHGEDWKTW